MKISDSFLIHAAPEKVWNFFLDIERMSRCVPGVESVEAVDDKTYRGKLKVKVGPIAATFGGVARLTELDPPRRLVASVEGDDKASASAVKAAFEATLAAAEGGTEVSYQMDVTLRGRLAQFGGPVIGATAKKMTAEFAKNTRRSLKTEFVEPATLTEAAALLAEHGDDGKLIARGMQGVQSHCRNFIRATEVRLATLGQPVARVLQHHAHTHVHFAQFGDLLARERAGIGVRQQIRLREDEFAHGAQVGERGRLP